MKLKVTGFIFIFLIFYIGSATILSTVNNTINLIEDKDGNIVKRVVNYIKKVDDDYINMLDFKKTFFKNKATYINLNGFMANAMGQVEMNKRVKLKNGHLTSIQGKEKTKEAEKQIALLCDKQKEKDKDFLFVLAPKQTPKYEDILPIGFIDYSNHNGDKLLKSLTENDIPFVDLREEMIKDGIDHSEAFFKTDHHWKPETGFWAYTRIIDYLIKNHIIDNVDSKFTDKHQYDIDVYKDWFLGSSGKRTGKYYAGVDDFAIIKPKFDTFMKFEIDGSKVKNIGKFEEVTYDYKRNKKDYFSSNPYGAYGHGDRGFIRYENNFAPINKRVLLIGDSFANSVYPFLSLVIKPCNQLDMRHYKGDFAVHYEEYNPDIIIVLISTNGVTNKNVTYDFFGGK